jgi:hypothetical protein
MFLSVTVTRVRTAEYVDTKASMIVRFQTSTSARALLDGMVQIVKSTIQYVYKSPAKTEQIAHLPATGMSVRVRLGGKARRAQQTSTTVRTNASTQGCALTASTRSIASVQMDSKD